MKNTIIIGLLIIGILVISGGCANKTPTTTAPATIAPTAVNSDVIPKQAGCGDKICAENEMCDKATLTTVCPEDCGIRCGPSVKVLAPTCEGSCSVSGNTVTVKGSSLIKLTLENSGEIGTDDINSNFKCDYADGSGLFMKTELGDRDGYTWDDYFEGGSEQASVSGVLTGNNKLTYILSLSGKTDKPADTVCRTGFSSSSFSTAVVGNYNINLR